jgi:putative transposase
VFWSHALEGRSTGWLDETFHRDFRELLAHAGAKYQIACPAYCLMPDHFHLVWIGLRATSDQLNATQFLRKQINRLLTGEGLVDRRNLAKEFRSPACEGGAVIASSTRFGSMPATASQPSLRRVARRSFNLQHQAHDHVLTAEERKRNAFAKTCFYILQDPQRANLVREPWSWPFCGALFPGYPSLWPFDQGYWPLFWKLYLRAREAAQPKSCA